jgi:hypothetical protein
MKKPASGFFTELDNQVRLGIIAPKEIAVDRSEVHERKMAEQRTSGATAWSTSTNPDSAPAQAGGSASRGSLAVLSKSSRTARPKRSPTEDFTRRSCALNQ